MENDNNDITTNSNKEEYVCPTNIKIHRLNDEEIVTANPNEDSTLAETVDNGNNNGNDNSIEESTVEHTPDDDNSETVPYCRCDADGCDQIGPKFFPCDCEGTFLHNLNSSPPCDPDEYWSN